MHPLARWSIDARASNLQAKITKVKDKEAIVFLGGKKNSISANTRISLINDNLKLLKLAYLNKNILNLNLSAKLLILSISRTNFL